MSKLIKSSFNSPATSTDAQTLVKEFVAEDIQIYPLDLKKTLAGAKYQKASLRLKCEVVLGFTEWLDKNTPPPQTIASILKQINFNWQNRWKMQEVLSHLLRQNLPFTEEEVLYLLNWSVNDNKQHMKDRKIPHVIKIVENHLKNNYLSETLQKNIVQLLKVIKAERVSAENRRWMLKLNEFIGETEASLPLQVGDVWADAAIADLKLLDTAQKNTWAGLLVHCLNASGSTPSTKWLNTADKFLSVIGLNTFHETVTHWFSLADKPRSTQTHAYDQVQMFLDVNGTILKGLVWCCSKIDSPEIANVLTKLAISCYKKIPGVGPRATKVGNACFWALANLPNENGAAQLSILKTRIKINSAQKLIGIALESASKRTGISATEIEEMSVPTYGLQNVGIRKDVFDDVSSEVRIKNGEVEQLWVKNDAKILASVPKAIKEKYSAELKELSQVIKDIRKMLTVQRDRIDNLYLLQQKWTFETWQERYIQHPLVGTISQRIIWKFSKGDKSTSAIWLEGKFVDRNNQPVNWLDDSTTVELWHPIEVETNVILEWRKWLVEHEVQQPFKQAHREVYILTDAERNTRVYSNRYAAHILRQHQFHSLCAIRGWKNSLRLLVDDEFPPARKELSQWGLRVEYWIEGIGDIYGTDTNESGTFFYVTTDQVRFYRIEANENRAHAGGGGYLAQRWHGNGNAEPIPLEEIPALVFSEIMRDVDMFVGVASIGNDPNWLDGGNEVRYRDYWHSYSFGDLSESAKTRMQLLETLIPRLKIANRCKLTDKFLIVRGDIRTYNIHLGSGNILMEPNNQYLCIVPSRSNVSDGKKEKLFVPFEGDSMLAIILSKAFLLADDKNIKDPTITRQLRM